jgi:ABC-type multidrug transport system fused ATPase/permease subunit
MKNKTCIVIAHRLSTIAKMDKIIVMDNWKIKFAFQSAMKCRVWIPLYS